MCELCSLYVQSVCSSVFSDARPRRCLCGSGCMLLSVLPLRWISSEICNHSVVLLVGVTLLLLDVVVVVVVVVVAARLRFRLCWSGHWLFMCPSSEQR